MPGRGEKQQHARAKTGQQEARHVRHDHVARHHAINSGGEQGGNAAQHRDGHGLQRLDRGYKEYGQGRRHTTERHVNRGQQPALGAHALRCGSGHTITSNSSGFKPRPGVEQISRNIKKGKLLHGLPAISRR